MNGQPERSLPLVELYLVVIGGFMVVGKWDPLNSHLNWRVIWYGIGSVTGYILVIAGAAGICYRVILNRKRLPE